MTKEVWIVKGVVTDPDAHGVGITFIGEPEYQFSDGPSGNRSMSSDYVDLEKGLQDHSGCIIHWECKQ